MSIMLKSTGPEVGGAEPAHVVPECEISIGLLVFKVHDMSSIGIEVGPPLNESGTESMLLDPRSG